MSRRILIQVTGPTVLIGLVLLGACLIGAWHVNRQQRAMNEILVENVASLRAAQQLEICVRQLRLHCFAYLVEPDPELLQTVQEDHGRFDRWLVLAMETATTAEERAYLRQIEAGYDSYQVEFERLCNEVAQSGPRRDFRVLAEAHPLREVIETCRKYLEINEDMMSQAAAESVELSQWVSRTMLLLGLGAPLGGLVSGYGIARGLSRSLQRLSVRVHDVAHRLDEDIAAVNIVHNGDLGQLDCQLDRVVQRVGEVMARLHQQQRDMLRAQQLAGVGQLAASVAHEIRNPLTSIKMLVEAALREQRPRPFDQEKLRIVHLEVLRVQERVQDFLDFARPRPLVRVECDLRDIVCRALELVQVRARQQRVQVDVDVPAEPLPSLIDRGQMSSVIVNLLLNALDAMPRGGRLTVRLHQDGGGRAMLAVTDSGPGIAAEMEAQLFVPFVSTKETGSGLGLSICRRVVEEHGGTIEGANVPAGGACFTITLPAAASEELYACSADRG